jgi:lipoate-protein ligase A
MRGNDEWEMMNDERGDAMAFMDRSSFILPPSSFQCCRLILSPPASGPWNMAADECLLQKAAAGDECCLRLYGWESPTLSLGYFQNADDRLLDPRLSGAAVVRRISGGGAILHDRELTYCLTVPAAHPLAHGPHALYRAAHAALVETLQERGIAASLCGGMPSGKAEQPFLCFQRKMAGDVVVGDAKVAGSAQRRIQGAILQHGSLLWARSRHAPDLPGLHDLAGSAESLLFEEEITRGWMNKLAATLVWNWRPDSLSDDEQSEIARLVRDKYASPQWTRDRLRGSQGELL